MVAAALVAPNLNDGTAALPPKLNPDLAGCSEVAALDSEVFSPSNGAADGRVCSVLTAALPNEKDGVLLVSSLFEDSLLAPNNDFTTLDSGGFVVA